MGKKKENKKMKPARETCFDGMEIDSRETLLAVIDELHDFCNENILALKPLLDEVEDNEIIKRRIINFVTMSDILDSVEQLADANIETAGNKCKCGCDECKCECDECKCGCDECKCGCDECKCGCDECKCGCDECKCNAAADETDDDEESEIPVKIVKKPCKNCKSKKKGK